MSDLAQMVESIPDILGIRFSRVDRVLAEVKETQAAHTQRFIAVHQRLERADGLLASIEKKLDRLLSRS